MGFHIVFRPFGFNVCVGIGVTKTKLEIFRRIDFNACGKTARIGGERLFRCRFDAVDHALRPQRTFADGIIAARTTVTVITVVISAVVSATLRRGGSGKTQTHNVQQI